MKTLLTSEVLFGLLFFIAILIMLLIIAKDKRHKWHQPEVFPEPMQHNERISKNIIVRDLTTEKEFRGYYDYSLEKYMNYDAKMVFGVFIWRYDDK